MGLRDMEVGLRQSLTLISEDTNILCRHDINLWSPLLTRGTCDRYCGILSPRVRLAPQGFRGSRPKDTNTFCRHHILRFSLMERGLFDR